MTLTRSPPAQATSGARNRPFTTPLKALLAAIANPSDCSLRRKTFFKTKGKVSESIELATPVMILTLNNSQTILTTLTIEVA